MRWAGDRCLLGGGLCGILMILMMVMIWTSYRASFDALDRASVNRLRRVSELSRMSGLEFVVIVKDRFTDGAKAFAYTIQSDLILLRVELDRAGLEAFFDLSRDSMVLLRSFDIEALEADRFQIMMSIEREG